MILTKALSGIARSGATRSGYPVFTGVKVPLYALSNVARSGATRSNYVGGNIFINIGGIDYGWGRVGAGVGVLAESLTKSDAINNTPVTLAFTARGWVPVEGADVIVTLGSRHNDRREFGGTILSTRHRYVGDDPIARNMLYDVSCIDYTWGLDRRKVSGNYTNASVAAIVASLMVSAPSGYTSRVDPDIGGEILDQITFTEQGLSSAFAQLATRVGGDFLCDFSKVVHLFFENTALSPPTIVNAVHPSLREITFTRDLSQVATRVLGSFGGSNALDAVAPGDIFLPVETAAWYLPAGGTVIVGQQRVTYSGVDNGGGGSLVGPGAAPSSVPNATLAPGAGVDVGTHDYAITYRTATGESVPGPRLTVPVGVFLPPVTAPTVGTPVSGATGPDPGAHDYAVSFVISTGETVPGPRVVGSTGLTAVPTAAPTPDALGIGDGPDEGTPHDYAVTFVTPSGETPAGPIGGQITTSSLAPPTPAPVVARTLDGTPALPAATYDYACTLVITGGGETTPGPLLTFNNYTALQPTTAPTISQHDDGSSYDPANGAPGQSVSYAVTWWTASGESALSQTMTQVIQASSANALRARRRDLIVPAASDPRVIQISVYCQLGTDPGYYRQMTSVPSAGATYNVATFAPYLPPPTQAPSQSQAAVVTAYGLAGMPVTTDPAITAHKLYRRVSGVGALQLVRSFPPSVAQFGIPPPGPVNTSLHAAAGPLNPGFYYYAVTFLTVEGETTPSPFNTNGTQITAPGTAGQIDVTAIALGVDGWGVTGRKLYRTTANGTTYRLVATFNDNTTTSYTDGTADASLGGAVTPTTNTTGDRVTTLGAAAPAASTAFSRAVHLSGIPTSPTGASARNLYRRSAGAGLRLAATIANNSATSYVDTTKNAALGVAPPASNTALTRVIPVTAIPVGNALVTARKLYRTPANTGGGALKLVATLADNTTTSFVDTVTDAALGAAALTVGTAQAAQVQLSAIPLGAAAVTARLIYRSRAGTTPLLLRATLADNTTTTYLDVLPDSTLGAVAPVSDLSGLQQPTGNIFAGSPTLICASVAGFRPAGGWATVGSQNVRYTGITGNALIGIPPSGPGAITATITYNTTAVAAAMLTGVPATGLGVIKYPILKGDPVNLWIQVDDLAAQAAVRAQLPGSDGIIEDEIQDGRLSYTEGRARCQARVDLLAALDSDGKVGVISVSYVCRDLNTIAGATTTINLGPPINLRGDFLIQRVGVNQFHIPNLHPTYTVEASSLRFSAEEMLRLLRQGAM